MDGDRRLCRTKGQKSVIKAFSNWSTVDAADNEELSFGVGRPSWQWVVGIYLSPTQDRFVGVKDCRTQTLMAVIDKYI